MVYGEIGGFPMDIVIKLGMVMFWNSLIDNSGKLSSMLYKINLCWKYTRVVKQILSGSSI